MQTIVTEKAEVNILENDLVEKHFHDTSRAKKEYNNIYILYELFKETNHEQWIYQSVKPVDYRDKTIVMELAQGLMYEQLMKGNPSISYQTGVWFGFYHNYCREYGEKEIKNIDYNRKNIFIDLKQNIVTIIDPGGKNFDRNVSVEEALINYIVGLVIGSIEQRIHPKKLIQHFLRGYFSVTKEKFNMSKLRTEMSNVINNRYNIQKTRNKNKLTAYLSLNIIKRYLLMILPQLIREYAK